MFSTFHCHLCAASSGVILLALFNTGRKEGGKEKVFLNFSGGFVKTLEFRKWQEGPQSIQNYLQLHASLHRNYQTFHKHKDGGTQETQSTSSTGKIFCGRTRPDKDHNILFDDADVLSSTQHYICPLTARSNRNSQHKNIKTYQSYKKLNLWLTVPKDHYHQLVSVTV